MLKSNPFKACLLIPAIVFCLSLNGVFADPCPDCPPNMSTIQGTVDYPDSWFLKWDPNNPDTMGRGTQVNVNVLGGRAPYSWSVSGSGFSLAESQTQGLSNTLFADGTACGSAVVAVTDSHSSSPVEGSVRAPDHGQWVEIIPAECMIPGPPTSWADTSGHDSLVRVEGKYRQVQLYHYTLKSGVSRVTLDQCEAYFSHIDCSSLCSSYPSSDPEWGCTECVKDILIGKDGCNLRNDWPYCVGCVKDTLGRGWYPGIGCRTSTGLQLFEWQCQ